MCHSTSHRCNHVCKVEGQGGVRGGGTPSAADYRVRGIVSFSAGSDEAGPLGIFRMFCQYLLFMLLV